ncbi:MAG: LamG-like jellyroll fold domain-containing protein [Candidatus Marinimicrobia bacterium]|nr:LamG-like jellyroll fold domain-containing protein [Candidatus Neomarinimicrobiota bacterium]
MIKYLTGTMSRAIFGLIILISLPGEKLFSQKAAHFESPGDFIEIPYSASLAPPEFTIAFWLRVNELGNPDVADGEQTVLDIRGNSAGYNVRLAGNRFPLPVYGNAASGSVSTIDCIFRGEWHHIAITQDNDSLRIYFNSELHEVVANNYASNTNTSLRIGEFLGYPGAYFGLRGDIDELRIWDHARDQSTIQSLMYEKLNGSETGLSAYWDFDSQSDSIIADLSVNNNNGILNGNARLIDSNAPVGFIPPPAPKGLRAYGQASSIELAWKQVSGDVGAYQIYRGNSPDFLADEATFLVKVSAQDSTFTDLFVSSGENYFYKLRALNQQQFAGPSSRTAYCHTSPITEDFATGVYYYPWWGPPEGHHWEEEYLRDYLLPRQPPMLGHHSSRDPQVIRQHLQWMQTYGIDFIVCSWWGPNSMSNITLRDYMLAEIVNTPIKFTIFFEPFFDFDPDGLIRMEGEKKTQVINSYNYIAETYFDHPNFLKIEGKPAVFIYSAGCYAGNYEATFDTIRSNLKALGHELFLVGDEVGWGTSSASHMQFLDAVTPYILYGHPAYMGYPIQTGYFADVSVQVSEWQAIAGQEGKFVIPNVHPGFYGGHAQDWTPILPHPRQIEPGASCTSFLEESIKVMRTFVDPQLKMIMITSWNEWHEDSQIEPTIVTPPSSTDVSDSGNFYTFGFTYEGYGLKPLEVIRRLLAPELPVSVAETVTNTPKTFKLLQNYPNPFNPSTKINYDIPTDGHVKIIVFDIQGKIINILLDGYRTAGNHSVNFDGSDLTSGIYFYTIKAGNFRNTKKMILIR